MVWWLRPALRKGTYSPCKDNSSDGSVFQDKRCRQFEKESLMALSADALNVFAFGRI
jgi:hypothetical protein